MNVFAQTNSFLYSNTGTPNTQQNNSFASTNINKIGSYRDQQYKYDMLPSGSTNNNWSHRIIPTTIAVREKLSGLSLLQIRLEDYYSIRIGNISKNDKNHFEAAILKGCMSKKVCYNKPTKGPSTINSIPSIPTNSFTNTSQNTNSFNNPFMSSTNNSNKTTASPNSFTNNSTQNIFSNSTVTNNTNIFNNNTSTVQNNINNPFKSNLSVTPTTNVFSQQQNIGNSINNIFNQNQTANNNNPFTNSPITSQPNTNIFNQNQQTTPNTNIFMNPNQTQNNNTAKSNIFNNQSQQSQNIFNNTNNSQNSNNIFNSNNLISNNNQNSITTGNNINLNTNLNQLSSVNNQMPFNLNIYDSVGLGCNQVLVSVPDQIYQQIISNAEKTIANYSYLRPQQQKYKGQKSKENSFSNTFKSMSIQDYNQGEYQNILLKSFKNESPDVINHFGILKDKKPSIFDITKQSYKKSESSKMNQHKKISLDDYNNNYWSYGDDSEISKYIDQQRISFDPKKMRIHILQKIFLDGKHTMTRDIQIYVSGQQIRNEKGGIKLQIEKQIVELGIVKPSPVIQIIHQQFSSTQILVVAQIKAKIINLPNGYWHQPQIIQNPQLVFLTIGNIYGQVNWINPIDVQNIDFSNCISIHQNSFQLYEQIQSPLIGTELNQDCFVTYYSCDLVSKYRKKGIQLQYDEIVSRLNAICRKNGIQFISYNPITENWKIKITARGLYV